MRFFLLLVLCVASLIGAEPGPWRKHSVTVTVTLESVTGDQAVVQGVFTPDPSHPEPLHLYDLELPKGRPGVPTRIDLPADSPLSATGPLVANQRPHDQDGLPIFPPGPVTVRLPVRLPAGDGGSITVAVLVSYLACTEDSCLIPVKNGRVELVVPTVQRAATTAAIDVERVRLVVREELANAETTRDDAVRELVRQELANHQAPGKLSWKTPRTVAEAQTIIDQAAAAKQPVLLDFTGPSCLNCQVMEKTVFRLPAVQQALGALVLVKIDTDPPNDELATWQQERFKTQSRPLYVHLADGREERWSQVFAPGEAETLQHFLAFLGGGQGVQLDTGAAIWWLAILGGLVTLLMPCTYPMIPFTISFFTKQTAAGRALPLLAATYGLGIVGSFVGLGLAVTLLFGSTLSKLAGSPWTNLLVAVLFVFFGLVLLGAVLLRLPGGLQDRLGSRSGYLGSLTMGLVFALTAFTCTAPIAGSLLAAAATTGAWGQAVWGLTIYGLTIAIPLVALALVPGLVKQLPRSGGWLGEVKVVGGVVELAAALKFLVICDHAWGWGVFGRSTTLAVWAACAVALGLYSLGVIRWKDDAPIAGIGLGRLALGTTWLALGLWFAAGLAGTNLGLVEGFFPGDAVPE